MLKFYILVSSNVGGLLRHFSPHYSNLDPCDAEVVINTIKPENERDLAHACDVIGVKYHITKSDGTPAQGKNSLLEIFENSDNDYCVQIDGDDYLTPHGVWFYKHVASLKTVPDAICLKNQIARCLTGKIFDSVSEETRKFFTIEPGSIDYSLLQKNLEKNNTPPALATQFTDFHREYYATQERYCEDQDAHCRVTFFSKVAASYRFNNNFLVGEDTLHYYELKNAHFNGKLTFVCNDECPATYIYNQTEGGGTVWQATQGYADWSWMGKFNEAVQDLKSEGKLWSKDLPLLKIHYGDSYVVDDYSTAGLVRYGTNTQYVELPANAVASCISSHLKKKGKSFEK